MNVTLSFYECMLNGEDTHFCLFIPKREWGPTNGTLSVYECMINGEDTQFCLFIPKRGWGPTNSTLSFYECMLNGEDTQGQLNPTSCNLLYSEVVRTLKHLPRSKLISACTDFTEHKPNICYAYTCA